MSRPIRSSAPFRPPAMLRTRRSISMKPAILLMVRELHHGGSERQMTEVALSLDRDQFTPHVGAFIVGGSRADELRAAGVPVVKIPVRSLKSPRSLAAAWELTRYIRANNI